MLGVTSIVLEEANPIGGGIWARHGDLHLAWVVAAVAIGTWIPSIGLYLIGRWKVAWVRERWPEKRRLLAGALTVVRRHPWRASLAIRFAWGLRLPLPIACGAARLPLWLYVIASGISCWAWAAAFTYLGFAAGSTALAALKFTKRFDVRLALVVLLVVLVVYVITRRRRIGERTAEVLSGEEISLTTTAERVVPDRDVLRHRATRSGKDRATRSRKER